MRKIKTFALFFIGITGVSFAEKLEVMTKKEDIQIVEIFVEDANEWLQKAWEGKVSGRRNALVKEYVEKCLREGTPILSTEDEIIKEILKEYKSRKEIEAAK